MTYSTVIDPNTGQPSATVVRRDSDGAFVPADPLNTDWQAYQAWRADGNEPSRPAPAPAAPA